MVGRRFLLSLIRNSAGATGAAGTAITLSPSTASAATSSSFCETWVSSDRFAMARCNTPTSYRIEARCEENSGATYTAYGNWVSNNSTSYAQCHEYAWVIERWVKFAT